MQNAVLSNQYAFSPSWLGSFTFDASYLHATAARNGDLGFALAFPFSSTSKTISGFETYGDNQFVTPITAFPILRNQEKYQFKYDVSHSAGTHAPRFGVDFIHEPVLSGALPGNPETLYVLTENPTFYLSNPAQLTAELNCLPPFTGAACQTTSTAAEQRQLQPECAAAGALCYGLLACDSDCDSELRIALGHDLRIISMATGVNQNFNAAVQTIRGLDLPLPTGIPSDYRKAFAPRLGIAWSARSVPRTW